MLVRDVTRFGEGRATACGDPFGIVSSIAHPPKGISASRRIGCSATTACLPPLMSADTSHRPRVDTHRPVCSGRERAVVNAADWNSLPCDPSQVACESCATCDGKAKIHSYICIPHRRLLPRKPMASSVSTFDASAPAVPRAEDQGEPEPCESERDLERLVHELTDDCVRISLAVGAQLARATAASASSARRRRSSDP